MDDADRPVREPGDPVPVDLRDYVAFDLDRPAGRRVFVTRRLALDLVCLEPGQTVPARTLADADVAYTVLGGRAWVVTDQAEVTLDPLQAVLVPAGVPHGVRNESADPLILQAVVTPPHDTPSTAEGPAVAPTAEVGKPPRPGFLDRVRRVLGG